jgi:hypothetical protein
MSSLNLLTPSKVKILHSQTFYFTYYYSLIVDLIKEV